jgi:hypothetical protein
LEFGGISGTIGEESRGSSSLSTKQQQFYKDVERFKVILRKRKSEYLRFLLTHSGGASSKEVAAAARELLRERKESE